jgi:transketolase
VDAAIAQAKNSDKPTLICCRTTIGKGAPTKQGSHDSHGAPLGAKEIADARAGMGWTWEPFVIPQEVYAAWDAKEAGARAEAEWNKQFDAYRAKHSAEAAEFVRRMNGELPAKWAQDAKDIVEAANQKGETIATRKASQQTLDGLAAALPELLGGSADLTGSNLTNWKASKPVRAGGEGTTDIQWGNHINYGVREFGMSAAINGIVLHGG